MPISIVPSEKNNKIDSSIIFPNCKTCDSVSSLNENSWSFHNYSSFLCGKIDTAFLNLEKNSFTFFGPSNCSKDTVLSLVGSFYPTAVFDKDLFNITSSSAILYLSANNIPKAIFKPDKGSNTSIKITIDTFSLKTGILIGKFTGYTSTESGDSSYISSGKFNLIIKPQ